jgi:hypothetical protein
MAQIERTESICTLSWINSKTGLPENDGDGPPYTIPGPLLTREDDTLRFRFVNLLEAKVFVSVNGSSPSPPRILGAEWTAASKIYKNPSFASIPSEPFQCKRTISHLSDRVVFRQTLGARTVSPEVIGETVGAAGGVIAGGGSTILMPITERIGRAAAHALSGFPPIWTTIQLTLFADGRSEGKVLQYSLFPSMNFYTRSDVNRGQPRTSSIYQLVGKSYDAVPKLKYWEVHGWGVLHDDSGPCEGNPWGYSKNDLTIRPVASPQTRVV